MSITLLIVILIVINYSNLSKLITNLILKNGDILIKPLILKNPKKRFFKQFSKQSLLLLASYPGPFLLPFVPIMEIVDAVFLLFIRS
jgi:hypothetical protein